MAYIKPKTPLRFNKSNNYFYPITTADQIIIDENNRLADYSIIPTKEINIMLLADNWVNAGRYHTQLVFIRGLTEDYNVGAKIIYSGNLERDLLIEESANSIRYAIQNDDTITFYRLGEIPTLDIPIELEVSI